MTWRLTLHTPTATVKPYPPATSPPRQPFRWTLPLRTGSHALSSHGSAPRLHHLERILWALNPGLEGSWVSPLSPRRAHRTAWPAERGREATSGSERLTYIGISLREGNVKPLGPSILSEWHGEAFAHKGGFSDSQAFEPPCPQLTTPACTAWRMFDVEPLAPSPDASPRFPDARRRRGLSRARDSGVEALKAFLTARSSRHQAVSHLCAAAKTQPFAGVLREEEASALGIARA
jgi:hypothetical protein